MQKRSPRTWSSASKAMNSCCVSPTTEKAFRRIGCRPTLPTASHRCPIGLGGARGYLGGAQPRHRRHYRECHDSLVENAADRTRVRKIKAPAAAGEGFLQHQPNLIEINSTIAAAK